jgi:predicted permease
MGWQHHLSRERLNEDWSEEFASHIEIATDEYIAAGMPPAEAAAAARRRFGNPTFQREQIYRMNTISFLDTVARDIRYGFRMMGRNPAFTAVAILTLAIGIGANSAVFTVINSVLLRPLPYPHQDELVAVKQVAPGAAGLATLADGLRLSASMYFTYAEQNRVFQSFGVWGRGLGNVTGRFQPEQIRVAQVTDGVLQALGVPPAAGNWLTKDDQDPRAPQRVMLSYGYWQRRFGRDPSAVGAELIVDAIPRRIAGVMPSGFRPGDMEMDVIAPLRFDRARTILAGFGFAGVARLKPGVTVEQANADLARMVPVWISSWNNGPGTTGEGYKTWKIGPAIRPLKTEVIGNMGDVLWAAMGTIGLVMLIACANVTNLLLVRADARRQELAIRAALGAGRRRIIRELLVESVMLGLMGGVLGMGLAYGSVRLLTAFGPADLPRLAEISIDAWTLAFTLVVSLFAGLVLGLIPALRYARPQEQVALRGMGRNSSASREHQRARSVLIVSQVAMALVLLVCAGLMIRTFEALRTVDPGFSDPRHVQTLRIAIPPSDIAEPERVLRMQHDILDKLRAIPGVTSAGLADAVAMEGAGHQWDSVRASGHAYQPGEILPLRWYKFVSPGFFAAMGTRIVAGRDLTWTEVHAGGQAAIISENLAREFWGSARAAVGQQIRTFDRAQWREVVGVVQDVRETGAGEKPPAIVYWSAFGNIDGVGPKRTARNTALVVRSDRAGTEAFLNDIRRAVWSVNSNLPVAAVRTMQDIYGQSLGRTSFTLIMLAIAGGMALLLGIIGIYGVISYVVSQRRREIGIRLALGSPLADLRRMFVRHGMVLVGIGVLIGLAASAGLTRLLKSLLFEVSPLDPVTYVEVPLVLGLAAVLASYIPARRASLVDPTEALRME